MWLSGTEGAGRGCRTGKCTLLYLGFNPEGTVDEESFHLCDDFDKLKHEERHSGVEVSERL